MTRSEMAGDLLQDEARQMVLDVYGRIDASGSSVAESLYPPGVLDGLPAACNRVGGQYTYTVSCRIRARIRWGWILGVGRPSDFDYDARNCWSAR